MQEGPVANYGGISMTRTFAIFAALAVAAVLVFVVLGRNGVTNE
jgi:hypothetical protein